jgi:hypothetical protein
MALEQLDEQEDVDGTPTLSVIAEPLPNLGIAGHGFVLYS